MLAPCASPFGLTKKSALTDGVVLQTKALTARDEVVAEAREKVRQRPR